MKPTPGLIRSTAIGLVFLMIAALGAARLGAQVVVRGPYLQMGTSTSVIVRWRTDVPTDSYVTWGVFMANQSSNATDPTMTTEHSVTITGLTPNTRYFYSIGSTAGILAGGTNDYFFLTSPPTGQSKKTRIWVLGDSGTGGSRARSVRDAYYDFVGPRHTDLWLMLGDNAYSTGTDAEYQGAVFQDMYEDMLKKSVVWSTPGNHDEMSSNSAAGTGPYYDIFTQPTAGEAGGVASGTEAYYSFDYGDIHFVSLCSATTDPNFFQTMLTWLQADLASTNQRWIIAFWHHPPYSKGSHDSDGDIVMSAMRQNVNPILESYGVDLVLCGHSHSYERSMLLDGHYGLSTTFNPAVHAKDTGDGSVGGTGAYVKPTDGLSPNEGSVYVVSGSSGQVTLAPLNHPVMVRNLPVLGSVILDVEESQLDVRFLTAFGQVADDVTIVKGNASPVRRHQQAISVLSSWKYNDTGTNLTNAGWQMPNYDDSSWAVGVGNFGYGETYIATTTTPNLPTTYFRTTFNLAVDPSAVERMVLGMNYDDGAVVYLNGQELIRPSMPAGPISYSTLAINHEGGDYTLFDLSTFASALVPGQNVIAVEMHQSSLSSGDMAFDAHLVLEVFGDFLPPEAAGTTGDAGNQHFEPLRINGSTGGLGRSVDVDFFETIEISMVQPPTHPIPSDFVIFGRIGLPTPGEALSFGSIGTSVFTPWPLDAGNPLLFFFTSSYAPDPNMLVPSTAAPWSFVLPGGLAFEVELVFQGFIADTPGPLQTTNAVRMHVRL